MVKLDQINAVLIANQVNLSIFTQLWLVENNVIHKDEFTQEAFFTPMAVNIKTPKFAFLVIPDRIQVSIDGGPEGSLDILKRTLGKVSELLPHTPYQALGFNYVYTVQLPPQGSLEKSSQTLFMKLEGLFKDEFSSSDARFGIYLSKTVSGARLRLEIKPATENKSGAEVLIAAFNFQRDLKSPGDISAMIDSWETHLHSSDKLANALNSRLEGKK